MRLLGYKVIGSTGYHYVTYYNNMEILRPMGL